ncbi:MAG: GerMN domain-containing protein [Bacilli bacterium]|nr:GerMN domain-containing protein [Bacilli bacterium]
MKKKIIFLILLIIFIIVLFLIPKDTYKKIFGNNTSDSVLNETNNESISVYMVDENNMLVGVNAYVESIEEDIINQKFDILIKETGVFKEKYDTTINTMTKLLDYNLDENVLTLNLSKEFLESEGRTTLEQIVWSFCDDNIKSVNLMVDGENINCLNGFYFDKLNKEMGINITYESGFVFESKTTTVIEYLGSIIKPVTYVYYDENECDFIVSKLLKDFYETKEYDYVVNKDSIIIDLQTDTLLSENTKKSIAETIKYNMEINNIQIQGLNQVLLEINDNTGL